ncbi:MAG TPA: 4-hydroxy-tetrahydrodipicolinate reductase [Polyangiaceae bacterium]|jgi:4-hydroxy-tetrahydrodipicolinate reductase
MRLAVVGASGRMGRAIVGLAAGAGMDLVCAVGASDVGRDAGELAGAGTMGVPVVADVGALGRAGADVVVDFSAPGVTRELAAIAAAAGSAVVSGTTGLGDEERRALERAAGVVPVLWEPNMSVGVHLLAALVARAAAALPDWDLEIVEVHHKAKVDAPSGTALRLAEAARAARTAATNLVHGRQGRPGPRAAGEVGMHALRGGDVVGDHTVHLMGGGERLELTHRATSRDVFARGALRAAQWIVRRPPGRYTLDDVLDVKR